MSKIELTKKGKQMIMLTAVIVAILLALWLYLGNTVIGTTRLTVDDPNLPPELDGLTIAHLSDLHNTRFGKGQQQLAARLQAAKPDIIVVTGDLIDSRQTQVDIAVEAMQQAVALAPVYYVTGNHESRMPDQYRLLEEALVELGVQVLHDEATLWERDGLSLSIIGLDDPSYRKVNGNGNTTALQVLTELADPDEYTVVLSHRPELFAQYCVAGVNLVLCGHAHGGQVRIPFVGGVISPNQGLFPAYTEGSYTDGDTTMVVSRGLGNSLCPLRVNNPPELVMVTLRAAEV